MAHHCEEQYTAWLRSLTGISEIEAQIHADPPMEMLVVLFRDSAERVHEVFRVPTHHTHTQDLLAMALPKHLHATSNTLSQRMDLLEALKDPVALEECLCTFPALAHIEAGIRHAIIARERLGSDPTLVSLIYETHRQLSAIVFGLDDLTVSRIHMMIDD